MSLDLLGEGFDLHGGGEDLAFPHHENERAQSEGAGHRFARHWIHTGMVTIGGDKMSKSLGNFTTVEEALAQHDWRALRLAMLQSHYRRAADLGPAELDAATKAIERVDAVFRRAKDRQVDLSLDPDQKVLSVFRDTMAEDFDTVHALAAMFDAIRDANRSIDLGHTVEAAHLLVAVREILSVLGLDADASDELDDEIDGLVRERDEARAARDFARADALRDDLTARGIKLEDTPTGTIWHR